MIWLLIASSWILVVSSVLGLCVAARRGDEREERGVTVAARRELRQPSHSQGDVAARCGRDAEPARQLLGTGSTTG